MKGWLKFWFLKDTCGANRNYTCFCGSYGSSPHYALHPPYKLSIFPNQFYSLMNCSYPVKEQHQWTLVWIEAILQVYISQNMHDNSKATLINSQYSAQFFNVAHSTKIENNHLMTRDIGSNILIHWQQCNGVCGRYVVTIVIFNNFSNICHLR